MGMGEAGAGCLGPVAAWFGAEGFHEVEEPFLGRGREVGVAAVPARPLRDVGHGAVVIAVGEDADAREAGRGRRDADDVLQRAVERVEEGGHRGGRVGDDEEVVDVLGGCHGGCVKDSAVTGC